MSLQRRTQQADARTPGETFPSRDRRVYSENNRDFVGHACSVTTATNIVTLKT